jgi:hypothetical protein
VTSTTAVLRLSDIDIDASRTWVPDELVDAVWRKGELRAGGRIAQSAGMNVLLGEGDETESTLSNAMARLKAVSTGVRAAVQNGAQATLDIAIYLDEERPMSSTRFCQADLRVLEELGVSLILSAHISSVDPPSA